MKRLIVIQIALLLAFSSGFIAIVSLSDSYEEVFTRIVSVTCLSCIKLDPKTYSDFIFKTANGQPHPDFVIENLTKGPIFIAYRKDVCVYCDEMEELIKEIFNISFAKEENFYVTLNFNGSNVTFIHINRDRSSQILRDSLHIYDKEHVNGVPMFTVVTIKYDHDGIVKPCYSTLYSKLGLNDNEKIKEFIVNVIKDSISLYKDNIAGYKE